MATTYNNLYLDVRRKLRQADAADPTLEARELVCFATGKTREELFRDGGLYLSPELEKQVWELVQRHLDGEPVAYLIGEWEFYGLPLDISPDVLIPRPDTELLAHLAIEHCRTLPECRVLDLCAGSGCVGLAVAAHVPGARVVLGDISEAALRICRQNIRRNGLTGRVVPLAMDARKKPSPNLGEFHCIVSNPPYIPSGDIPGLDGSVRDFEPHLALDGGDGEISSKTPKINRAVSQKPEKMSQLLKIKFGFSYEEVHHFHCTYLATVRRILLNVDINRYSDESVINRFRSRYADCRVIFGIIYYG